MPGLVPVPDQDYLLKKEMRPAAGILPGGKVPLF